MVSKERVPLTSMAVAAEKHQGGESVGLLARGSRDRIQGRKTAGNLREKS